MLSQSSYLRSISLFVFLGAVMTGTIDYVFKSGVVAHNKDQSLVGFFAIFYTATGIITFLVQAFGTKQLLKKLGVVLTVGLFPAVAASLLGLAILVPSLLTLIALRAGAMVIENSLYRSAYELLYTAVAKVEKRSAKMLIDLGSDRLGTAIASGLTLLIIAWLGTGADYMLLLLAGGMAAVIITILLVIRREYVISLADQLRVSLDQPNPESEEISAQALGVTFAAEANVFNNAIDLDSDSSMGLNSHLTLEDLRAQVIERAKHKKESEQKSFAKKPITTGVSERLLDTPLRAQLRERTLNETIWAELLRTAPGLIGQLGDILLSKREPLFVRLRAVELLATVPSRRATDALLEALNAPELRLRRASALALLFICENKTSLRPSKQLLTDLAVRELNRPSRSLTSRNQFELDSPFLLDARGNEISSSLEMVFILLAINGDTKGLKLALTAITSEDPAQRGTGLEYLDNLLPAGLRSRILVLVENPEFIQAEFKVSNQVVTDLAQELRSGAIDLKQLRQKYAQARREQYEKG